MDQVSDFLIRIKNGYLAGQKEMVLPYGKFKKELADILLKNDYLAAVSVEGKKPAEKSLRLKLKYKNKLPSVKDVRRISKPGRRVYAGAGNIPRVKLGFGITIVSTSGGLLIDRKAREKKLGGEVICQIW